MSEETSFAERLKDYSELSVGTFFQSGSPNLAEALGKTSLEFLVLDRQHASPTLSTVENVLRATELNEMPVVVRLSNARSNLVNNVLDAGASGLMIPQVESVEQVSRVVREARYSHGRSFARGTRAGGFGTRDSDEYLDWVNDELVIIPQIETTEGMEVVDEIVRLDEVDVVMVGPGDLSFSLGVPSGSDKLREAVGRIISSAREANCGTGVWVPTPDEIDCYRTEASYVTYGSDIGVLASHFEDAL